MMKLNKIEERMINDISLLNLLAKILYQEPTELDKQRLYELILLLLEENTRLRHWDVNKDTRNSRQRVANRNMANKNRRLIEFLKELSSKIDFCIDESNKASLDLHYIKKDIDKLIGENEYED